MVGYSLGFSHQMTVMVNWCGLCGRAVWMNGMQSKWTVAKWPCTLSHFAIFVLSLYYHGLKLLLSFSHDTVIDVISLLHLFSPPQCFASCLFLVAMPLCPATRCLARCCNVASYPPDINWMPCTIPQYPLKCSVFLCWGHLILPRCASLQANTLTGLLEKETGGRSTMATGLTFWWIISLMGRNISFDHLIWGKKYALPSGYST